MKNSKKTKDLADENIENIIEIFKDRQDVEHVAKLVDYDDIVKGEYNLSVSTYVEAEDTREVVDITALNAEIKQIVAKQTELRKSIDEIVADIEGGK